MGRLVSLEACPVCNYNVEGMLHVGWSTRSQLFMSHRYDLAVCQDCHNVVSVLLPIPDYDVPLVSRAAESDLQELEDRAAHGDPFARVLLPIHRHALEAGEAAPDAEIGVCTVCRSRNLKLYAQSGRRRRRALRRWYGLAGLSALRGRSPVGPHHRQLGRDRRRALSRLTGSEQAGLGGRAWQRAGQRAERGVQVLPVREVRGQRPRAAG